MDSYWGSNENNVLNIAARIGASREQVFNLDFSAGTMFFCRTEPLLLLIKMISDSDFEVEAGQTDGTFAHAVERIFSVLMHKLGLSILDTELKRPSLEDGNYEFALKG